MFAVMGVYAVYAIVLLLGGGIGYEKAKSVPSLVVALAANVLISSACCLIGGGYMRPGLVIGVLVSLIAGAFFRQRRLITRRDLPEGLIMPVSVSVLILSFLQLFK